LSNSVILELPKLFDYKIDFILLVSIKLKDKWQTGKKYYNIYTKELMQEFTKNNCKAITRKETTSREYGRRI
jgi:hypothetical protein